MRACTFLIAAVPFVAFAQVPLPAPIPVSPPAPLNVSTVPTINASPVKFNIATASSVKLAPGALPQFGGQLVVQPANVPAPVTTSLPSKQTVPGHITVSAAAALVPSASVAPPPGTLVVNANGLPAGTVRVMTPSAPVATRAVIDVSGKVRLIAQ